MGVAQKVEKIIESLVTSNNMELVDVQYVSEAGRMVLRIYIDKDGGIKLDDCEAMSNEIGNLLDSSDAISDSYVLEVSSPGIDRALKKEKDFIKFLGERAKVSLYAPIDGQRNFKGKLLDFKNNTIIIADVTGKTVEIPMDKVAKAKLDPDV